MAPQFCVNCNAQPGYPHAADCHRPRFHGEPEEKCHRCRGSGRHSIRAGRGRGKCSSCGGAGFVPLVLDLRNAPRDLAPLDTSAGTHWERR